LNKWTTVSYIALEKIKINKKYSVWIQGQITVLHVTSRCIIDLGRHDYKHV